MKYFLLVALEFFCLISLYGQDYFPEYLTNPDSPSKTFQFKFSNSTINIQNSIDLCVPADSGFGVNHINNEGGFVPLIDAFSLMLGGETDGFGRGYDIVASPSFRSGPYSDSGNPVMNYEDWNRFWEVEKSEIDAHISDLFEDGTIDFRRKDVFAWPGSGNPYFEEYNGFQLHDSLSELAPFFDINDDGIYDPSLGDYPIIKGDHAVWWICNSRPTYVLYPDIGNCHYVVQGMAYTIESENSDVANTLFYNFKVRNMGQSFKKFVVTGLVDFDLGCHYDDLLGVDTLKNMVYAYNKFNMDTECNNNSYDFSGRVPMVGVLDLGNDSSKSLSKGGIFDVDYNPLSYSNVDPDLGGQFVSYLTGRWSDGSYWTRGGTGYNPESMDTVNYLFPGSPSDTAQWSMYNLDTVSIELGSIMSNGPYYFETGQTLEFDYAIIQADDLSHPRPDISGLQSVADGVIAHYNDNITNTVIVEAIDFEVYPNPAHSKLHVDMEDSYKVSQVQLNGIDGRLIFKTETFDDRLDIDVSQIENGLYFLSIFTKDGGVRTEKVVVMK